MAKKLTKEQLETKKKFHNKRVEYYDKKIKEVEKNKIGFKWYD